MNLNNLSFCEQHLSLLLYHTDALLNICDLIRYVALMKINYIIAFFTFTILNKDADIFLYLLPVIIGNEFIYIVTLFAKFDEKYEYSMIMVNLWQLLRVERRIFASKKLQNLDERFC